MNCHGLGQVERGEFSRRNTGGVLTVFQVVIGQASIFGPEKQGDPVACQKRQDFGNDVPGRAFNRSLSSKPGRSADDEAKWRQRLAEFFVNLHLVDQMDGLMGRHLGHILIAGILIPDQDQL